MSSLYPLSLVNYHTPIFSSHAWYKMMMIMVMVWVCEVRTKLLRTLSQNAKHLFKDFQEKIIFKYLYILKFMFKQSIYPNTSYIHSHKLIVFFPNHNFIRNIFSRWTYDHTSCVTPVAILFKLVSTQVSILFICLCMVSLHHHYYIAHTLLP